MTNPYLSSVDAFWGVISRFVSADKLSQTKLSTRLSIAGIQYRGKRLYDIILGCMPGSKWSINTNKPYIGYIG